MPSPPPLSSTCLHSRISTMEWLKGPLHLQEIMEFWHPKLIGVSCRCLLCSGTHRDTENHGAPPSGQSTSRDLHDDLRRSRTGGQCGSCAPMGNSTQKLFPVHIWWISWIRGFQFTTRHSYQPVCPDVIHSMIQVPQPPQMVSWSKPMVFRTSASMFFSPSQNGDVIWHYEICWVRLWILWGMIWPKRWEMYGYMVAFLHWEFYHPKWWVGIHQQEWG